MARKRSTPPPVHPFDEAHGVETGGLIPAGALLTGHAHDAHVTAYYGVAPSILTGLVDLWQATAPTRRISQYSFVDLGAGKGRALLVATTLGFKQVIGVELNPALADLAERNLALWVAAHRHDETAAPIAPARIVEHDALAFDFPAGPCVAFLFHPFEAPLMKKLLRRLEVQFTDRPRQLDILYVNAECASVFTANSAFQKLWFGNVSMSPADHAADLEAIATQREYGSTGDEECGIYRYIGRGPAAT